MRWSARLTGVPWRATPPSGAGTDRGTPSGDAVVVPGPRDPTSPTGPVDLPDALDPTGVLDPHRPQDLREVLNRIPAPVAVTYGPLHQLGYANRAYRELFGERPTGLPACDALPELGTLGVLPLMDQVIRGGSPRSVKARCILGLTGNRYYNVSCVPLTRDPGDPAPAPPSAPSGSTPTSGPGTAPAPSTPLPRVTTPPRASSSSPPRSPTRSSPPPGCGSPNAASARPPSPSSAASSRRSSTSPQTSGSPPPTNRAAPRPRSAATGTTSSPSTAAAPRS